MLKLWFLLSELNWAIQMSNLKKRNQININCMISNKFHCWFSIEIPIKICVWLFDLVWTIRSLFVQRKCVKTNFTDWSTYFNYTTDTWHRRNHMLLKKSSMLDWEKESKNIFLNGKIILKKQIPGLKKKTWIAQNW